MENFLLTTVPYVAFRLNTKLCSSPPMGAVEELPVLAAQVHGAPAFPGHSQAPTFDSEVLSGLSHFKIGSYSWLSWNLYLLCYL